MTYERHDRFPEAGNRKILQQNRGIEFQLKVNSRNTDYLAINDEWLCAGVITEL